jgi:hypothetical protein
MSPCPVGEPIGRAARGAIGQYAGSHGISSLICTAFGQSDGEVAESRARSGGKSPHRQARRIGMTFATPKT